MRIGKITTKFLTLSLLVSLSIATSCSKKKETTPTIAAEVTTLAGSGQQGSADGKGSQATFSSIWGITVDAAGNIYVTDTGLGQVRKITTDGVVTTLPDNAAAAGGFPPQYYDPLGVAIDPSGNIFVSYLESAVVRKITTDGKGSVFAGDGLAENKDGAGTSAGISQPVGLAADQAGNIYVAGYSSCSIRKISPVGVVTTIAGGQQGKLDGKGSAAQFWLPSGVTVDANGNIYIADSGNHLIRKLTPDGTVTTVAGSGSSGYADGKGAAASFNYPSGIAVDNAGNLYVADCNNNLIRKITPDGTVSTLAGNTTSGSANGSGADATFSLPADLVISPNGKYLYVADRGNNMVRQITIK